MGPFWVKEEVHELFWCGNTPPNTYYSCDKFRNKFNGQAWGHFGLEKRYIQDLV